MTDKKILGYMPLHYGKSYLKEAIQSISPFVDKIMVFYTSNPSFGHGTNHTCPDSGEDLKRIALAASEKVKWVVVAPGNEGAHRGLIYDYATGYDGILTIDSDEVFEQEDLPHALDLCFKTDKRYIGFGGYINFWKSFNYACYDGYTPIRFINLHNTGGNGVVPVRVYHFSTAQRDEIMVYKLLVHGHKDEIRPGWYEDIYKAWTPENNFTDLHLVALGLWNATPFDRNLLPECLKSHANYGKDVIE
mgnify:FL=1